MLSLALCSPLMLLGGCKGHKSESHEHEHEHAGVQICIYSDQYEIYAEADPLSVGQESNILAHVTKLSDYKPFDGADIQMRAVLDLPSGKVESQSVAQEEEGIYHLKLTPSSTGEGSITLVMDSQEFSAPVKVYGSDEEADEAAEHSKASSANGVAFSKEQSWKVDFATEIVKSGAFGKQIQTIGQVKSSQTGEQVLTAQSSGIVSIVNSTLLTGSKVAKGARLFDIKGAGVSDSNTEVQYQSVKSEYERAKSEYERKASLAQSKIVSRKELEEAQDAFRKAQAEFESFSGRYSGGAIAVYSGISGYISDIYVTNGEYVEQGKVLAKVANSNKFIVEASLPSRYYADLLKIDGANFAFQDGEVYSLQQLNGRIASVSNSVSEQQPLLKVNFEIEGRPGLLAGSFIKVYIKTSASGTSISVDNGALVEEMGDYFVYKQITPELFEKTQVILGGTDGLRSEILGGLSDGDRVVSKGAIIVKLAAAAGKLDAHSGHVH